MKNGKRAVLVATVAGILLVACGSRTGETATSGEMVVPEMSSEDLLVSSLEYLLLDEEETGQEPQERIEEDKKEPEASAENMEQGNDAQAQDQAAGQDELSAAEAVIYYGNGASHELNRETVQIEEMIPEALVEALSKHNIVSLDTKILSFEEEEQDGKKVLRLDLSRAAGEYLRTMSKEAECIIVASIVNTFLENYSADEMYLLVEGEALATSHGEYTEAVGRCTFDELMNRLEASGTEKVQRKLPLVQEKN